MGVADPRRPLPWRMLLIAAALGTAASAAIVLASIRANGGNVLDLIQPGSAGPAATVVRHDFPGSPLPPGLGHDGQQFYVIARQPMHPGRASAGLDRPAYRLQRPLYPVLAWLLHPSGGGPGLVRAMFVVGLLASFGGAVAMGTLAFSVGGPAWIGALFPLLPGAYVSLRISTADALAAALAAAALALAIRGHAGWSIVAAVAAILTREVTVVVFVGWALYRRDRLSAALVAIPLAVGAALALALRVTLVRRGTGVIDFTWPIKGLVDAVRHWSSGHDAGAAVLVALAVALAVAALVVRGVRSPLGGVVLLELLLVLLLRSDAHALWLNATRVELPLLLFSVVALACPANTYARSPTSRSE